MIVTVSVILTVFNESASIPRLVESLAAQTRAPDQVVVADGGSTDGTAQILRRHASRTALSLRVLEYPGANISQGRNRAIAAAEGEIIAVTDAGVYLEPNWLEELVRPFEQDPMTQIVSGFFVPDPHTAFEVAMGATVLPALSDIDPDTFLPSSRSVAFRRRAWEAIGGYPEWLDYCEDLILDMRLRDRYGPFAFAPQAQVRFRPRPNLRAFFLQYYRYARGDGKADLWRRRHALRYLTYGLATPALIFLALFHSAWWLIGFVVGGALYTALPYRRLVSMMHDLTIPQRARAIALVPVIRLVGDVAKMVGYPVGWAWRIRHRQEIPQ